MARHRTTFNNGLNQDVNVVNQPPGTYRNMQNGMLITQDGNNYTVENAAGNSVNFVIPPRYVDNSFNLDDPPLPIGFITFIDKLVVFSTTSSDPTPSPSTVGYGEIGVVTFDDAGQGVYKPLYYSNDLAFSKYFKIRGFGYPENEKTQRAYFTDFNNGGRVINIIDPVFLNQISTTGLVVGTTYMVVGGAVLYNGALFGPGLPSGNIFTAVTGTTTYSVADASPIVTVYLNPQALSMVPNRFLGNIKFLRYIAGTVTGGSKMYFFRLGFRQQGLFSSWSYGSFPVNVSGAPQGTYKDQQGSGGQTSTTNSQRGLRIQIDNIDTLFDTIEVVCASFDAKDNVITNIVAVALTPVTGSTMTFDHTGSEDLAQLSTTDLTTFSASIARFKDLATTKNYLTIGNIIERDEITFDASNITIADSVYLIPADEFGNGLNGSSVQQGTAFQNVDYGIPSGTIIPHGKYVVSGNPGDQITYNSVAYNVGQTFEGVLGQTTFSATATAIVLAAIVLNKYTDASSNPVNNVIPILNDFWDYKGMATTQYLRQYWSGETYRFAILFYDLKGNPYFARFIGDHTIQSVAAKGGLLDEASATNWSLKANGLKISGITIPPSLLANVSGFSILRAPRDVQRYAQGIVMQTVLDSGSNQAKPLSANLPANDNYYAANGGVANVYTYVSPDYLFNSSSISNISAVNQTLENVCYLNPISTTGPDGGIVNPVSFGSQGFVKYYSPNTTLEGNNTIQAFTGVGTGGQVAGITSTLTFVNDFLKNANFGGIFAHGNVANGGNCMVMRTSAGIFAPNGGGANDITSNAFQNNPLKPLSNIYIPKQNLYGGSSADAIANTPFISTGHYQDLTNINLSTVPVDGSGNYVFNNIDVFGGDSFVTILDYAKALYDDTLGGPSYSYSILFPVESNVNPSMRERNSVTRIGMQGNNGANGIYQRFNSTSNPEDFYVNDAYSSDGAPFQYPSLPVNLLNAYNFSYRARWTTPKIPGEQIDSFRVFPVNNFRDLDGQRGQINNLATKNGNLFCWQDNAVSHLPILERVLTEDALGQATQLGVGGVIDRFDELNTYFGNQHQNSLVETEYGFSWFDMRRRAWLIMTLDGAVQEISVANGLNSFFNTVFENQYSPNLILSQDTPLIGIGIHGVYDARFKTTFLTFKNFTYSNRAGHYSYANYDFTVGYNHVKNVIIGFESFTPAIWCQFNRYLISAKDVSPFIITANQILPSKSYSIGNFVNKAQVNYVCIAPLTTHNPVQPFEEPDAVSSAFWVRMCAENEVYTHWTGDMGKFYGLVYPFSLQVIINPVTENSFSVDNLETKATNVNWSRVDCSTDDDAGSDTRFPNRDYRYYDGKWFNNLPLGKKGRLVDVYLSIKFTINNFTANPTISTNLKKVITYIDSIFRERR